MNLPLRWHLSCFSRRSRGGTRVNPDLNDAYRALVVCDAARRSAENTIWPLQIEPVTMDCSACLNGTISRILIVSDYAGSRGGCELLAQTFRNGLRERGVDAYLLASTVDAFEQAQAPDGVFWGTSGRARCFPEIFNPSARAQLRKALRTFNPDVVHLLMFMTQASPAILPLLANRPVVYTTNTYRVICPTGSRLLPNGSLCTEHPGRVCLSNGCLSYKGWLPRMVQLQLLEWWRESIRCVVAPSAAMASELERGGWPVSKIIYFGVEQHQRLAGRQRDLALHMPGGLCLRRDVRPCYTPLPGF